MSARIIVSFDGGIVQEYELTKPVTVVGRHPDCDLVIEHPAVSGRHLLFRIVNRTVYVEDLASTNGTRVNGVTVGHQVIHHLDVIEVGRHKVHFFDDALLAGKVSNMESTVQTDYERTMMSFVAEPAPGAARAQPRPVDDELSRTAYIRRDPAMATGGVVEAERVDTVDTSAPPALALRVVSGEGRGELVSLHQANTMIGRELETALVIRRGHSYYLARFSSHKPPRLNRKELAPGAHPIAPNDLIEVGGTSFEVIEQ